jgi:hypothetical protein
VASCILSFAKLVANYAHVVVSFRKLAPEEVLRLVSLSGNTSLEMKKRFIRIASILEIQEANVEVSLDVFRIKA